MKKIMIVILIIFLLAIGSTLRMRYELSKMHIKTYDEIVMEADLKREASPKHHSSEVKIYNTDWMYEPSKNEYRKPNLKAGEYSLDYDEDYMDDRW